jgi:hypothetical protein
MTDKNELARRESHLIAIVEQELPDFARMCRDPGAELVLMHQDAFAAAYHEDEYKLLGMAIKFAGLCGKRVQIIGTNRGTVSAAS